MARRNYHHGDLKSEILKISRDLLERQGREAINMREIAKRAGVTPMATYTHYASKADVLTALAIAGFEELEAATKKALKNAGPTPEEEMQAIGVAYIMHGVKHPNLYAMMFQSMKSDAPDEALQKAADNAYDVLRGCLLVHADYFGFVASEIELHALSAWSMAHGMTSLFTEDHVRTRKLKTIAQKRKVIENTVRILTYGMRYSASEKLEKST